VEGHSVNKGRSKPLKLQQLDCHRGEVRYGAAISICDRTPYALLNHLQDGGGGAMCFK